MKQPSIDKIRTGKHIKTAHENGKAVAECWEYQRVQYVVLLNGNTVMLRDTDNEDGPNAALFPYGFRSTSMLRALRNKRTIKTEDKYW